MVALFIGLPITSFVYPGSNLTAFLGTFNILFVLGIPLLMLVLFIMRIFLRSNFRPKWQFGLWVFWFINLISLLMIGLTTAKDFQHGEEMRISEQSFDIPSDTLYVEMERSPFDDSWFRIGDEFLISDDDLIAQSIRVVFEKSPSGQLEVVQKNESRGHSLAEAGRLAEAVDFTYRIEGNKLILPSNFILSKGNKWRAQMVRLNVQVPEGMYVKRNREVARNTSWVEKDDDYKFPWHRYNTQIWKMGPNGMIAPDYISDYKKEYNLRNFSSIRVDGNVTLDIRQGRSYKIELDKNDASGEIEIIRSGDRLDISTNTRSHESYRLEITMPKLNELWAIQSRDIEIRDFKMDSLHIVNEGEGDIKAFSDIKSLDLHLTGRNKLEIRGEGGYMNAILSNDADLDAEHFTVKNANMELNNRSTAIIFATDTLWQKVTDSRLTSRRDPVIVDAQEIEEN